MLSITVLKSYKWNEKQTYECYLIVLQVKLLFFNCSFLISEFNKLDPQS